MGILSDLVQHMGLGFSVALTPINLFFCFIGVTLGTVIGALPGLGSVTGVAILLPLTFGMDPTTAIIMLAGIYYGVMYGGTISSILLNTPGDAAVVVSAIEGYPMARQGRAGAAFSMNALASFVGGTFGTIMLTAAAPAFAHAALKFGPPEYFSLMILGMASLVGLASSNPIKGLIMTAFGFLLSTVGVDAGRGVLRFTYDSVYMMTGINFLPVAIGMFGLGEVLYQMEDITDLDVLKTKIRLKTLLPTMADWIRSRMAIVRGSIIGFVVGVLPGAGATIASFLAYASEVKMTKHPEDIGKGAIEGLAAPEAANNAAAAGALVPMMTLGVPGSGTTAVLLGAFMMYGLQPGPMLFTDHPKLAWGVIASMYIGNVMLVILNTVFIPVFVSVLKMPQAILMPLILVLTIVGSYTLGNNMMDVVVMVFFGVIGYIAKKNNYPAAPLILGLVLGPIAEINFVRSSSLAQGDLTIFFTRPLSLSLLLGAFLSLAFPLIKVLFVRIRGLRR